MNFQSPKKRFMSIRTKLLLSASLPILLTLTFTFTYYPHKLHQQKIETLLEKVQMLADMTACDLVPSLRAGNAETISRTIASASSDSEVVFVALFAESGELITANDPNNLLSAKSSLNDYATFENSKYVVALSSANDVNGSSLKVMVAYSLVRILNSSDEFSQNVLALCLIVLAVSIGMTLYLGNKISLPVQSLVLAIEQIIESGEYSKQVPQTTHDELGTLTMQFNTMVRQIEKREVEKESSDALLTRQRILLEGVMNDSPGHIYIKDSSGRYLLVSKSMGESLGLEPSSMIGFTDEELGEKAFAVLPRKTQEQRVTQNSTREIIPEERFTFSDQSDHWFYTVLAPLSLTGTDEVFVIGFSVDITGDKESREIAYTAERMSTVGALAGAVAHEFKNFLAGIRGNSEYLQDILGDRKITAEESEVIADIIEATDNANSVAVALLTYSRRKPEVISPERISDIVEETLLLANQRAMLEKVEIVTSLDSTAMAHVSVSKIQQLILNLLGNALDAISEGGVITIIVSQSENEVILRIADSGSGIAPDNRDKIFDPFFSTRNVWTNTKAEKLGTGLGLSICKNIVEEHSGTIEFLSVEGKGTRFDIRIPSITSSWREINSDSSQDIEKYSEIVLFSRDEKLSDRYRLELSEIGCELAVETRLESSSWKNPRTNSLIVIDGAFGGTRVTMDVLAFSRKSNSSNAMINQPASDSIAELGSEFDYCTVATPQVQTIAARLNQAEKSKALVS